MVTRLISAGVSMVVSPAGFGSDKQTVVAAEEDLIVGGHRRAARRDVGVLGEEMVGD